MVDKKILEYILSVLVILVPTVIIILEIYYRKKKKNIETRQEYYKRRLTNLYAKDTQRRIDDLHEIVKDFFKEAYALKNFRGYYDLERFFIKNELSQEALFAKKMGELLYGDDKPTTKQNKEIEEMFKKIVEKTKISEDTNKK